jgi:hypothetical protein
MAQFDFASEGVTVAIVRRVAGITSVLGFPDSEAISAIGFG